MVSVHVFLAQKIEMGQSPLRAGGLAVKNDTSVFGLLRWSRSAAAHKKRGKALSWRQMKGQGGVRRPHNFRPQQGHGYVGRSQ